MNARLQRLEQEQSMEEVLKLNQALLFRRAVRRRLARAAGGRVYRTRI